MFVCPACGTETETSKGMACHCLLKHYTSSLGDKGEAGRIEDLVLRLVDTIPVDGANQPAVKHLAEIMACTGRCDNCSSHLLRDLQEAGYLDNGNGKRKWLYNDYPAVAIPGVYCLKYDNGFWFLRSEDPRWLHNPFQDEDGYWYEATLR